MRSLIRNIISMQENSTLCRSSVKENEQKQNRYIIDGRCSTFESR